MLGVVGALALKHLLVRLADKLSQSDHRLMRGNAVRDAVALRGDARGGRAHTVLAGLPLRRGGEYFLLRRLKGQTEARLHDKLSLGLGGHINPTEESAADPIEAGLRRELAEEVILPHLTALTCVGLINETTGGVSDYHTALVYLLETDGEVTVRETGKMSGSWVAPEDLREAYPALETWSQIVAQGLIFPGIV